MRRSSVSSARPSRRRTRTRGQSSAITFDVPHRSHPSGTSLRSCPSRSARFHLRHPARRRRQGRGADLLREPHLTPSRPRSVGLRPTRCVVYLARLLAARLAYRNDLDNQLFGQFQRCADILGQTPVQASGREHLRELLNRACGGVVFTTIHRFAAERSGDWQSSSEASIANRRTTAPTTPD